MLRPKARSVGDNGEQDLGSGAEFLPAGKRLGKYKIVRQIGAGGMGVVYEGTHEGLGKRVAIKTLHRQFAATPEMQARFVREGEAAARVRHAHVTTVDDVGVDEGIPYLVMEYLDGKDLGRLLDERGRLSASEIADIIVPVISAVAAAHDQGVVHRDLKPENIFLAQSPMGLPIPKVLDFGISKLTTNSARITSTHSVLGSPYYMSPEQADSAKSVEATSDVYSLGVILYQSVTGHMPFGGDSVMQVFAAIAAANPAPPRSLVAELPADFEEVILRAIRSNPAQRFPTARSLGAALWTFCSPRVRFTFEHEFSGLSATLPGLQPVQVVVPARVPAISTLGASVVERPSAPQGERTTSTRGRGIWGVALAGALLLAALAVLAARSGQAPATPAGAAVSTPPPAPLPKYIAKLTVEPAVATITLDGAVVGRGVFMRELEKDGAAHTLRVAAPGYEPQTLTFRNAPPPETVVLVALPAEALPRPGPVERSAKRKPKPQSDSVEAVAPAPKPPSPKKDSVVGTGANDSLIFR